VNVARAASASVQKDGQTEDETGFTMRLAAVILPDLGTGPDVPIVVSHWFVARGDRVWEGERLVEVLVGPATFDVASPVSGRLAEIRGLEDDRVESGSVLGLVATPEDGGRDQEPEWQSGRRGAQPPSSRPTT
jgi:pyruvate/2-oxoglutarate dehydrogenase complex dihydrolipoamide acyltransferase (E2) component